MQDCYAGADPRYRLAVRIITEQAWHSLFARHMFIDVPDTDGRAGDIRRSSPSSTCRACTPSPSHHGTNSEVFILLNFAKKLVLIGGSSYAGEIKKSIFTVMNYLLPLRNVLSMHCSANVGANDDVALFFGLSGTGKTTLSSDPDRQLIGDDEHGWSEDGVFNIEGGCYAKMIRLSEEAEPQIYSTTRRFGTVLENVKMDATTRVLDLDDDSLTENTRGAYPLEFIDNWVPSGQAGHPRNIVMLTADAFGVLPPIARLYAGGRDVSLPLGLHREGCGHREGRDRAEGDVQHLLRRAVHGAAPDRLREVPRRANRAAQRERVAGEHRLDGRTVWHRRADEDRAHPGDDPRGALRRSSTTWPTKRIALFNLVGSGRRARMCRRRC